MREPQKTILEKTKSIQDALRGLFLVKASIENDGLAAKVRNMRARHHRRH